jgi:hypothetical protein
MIGRDADPTALMQSKIPMAQQGFRILNPYDTNVGPQERPKGEYAPDLLPIALLWSILRNPYRVNGKSLKIDPIWPVEIAQMFR